MADETPVFNKKKHPANFKNVVDSPVKLRWPTVDTQLSQLTIELLMKSLVDINYTVRTRNKKMKTSLPDLDGIKPTTDAISKKDFLVVGINAFTRCLERGQMRAGVVCLSAKPELMTQHILMLSVVKNCPVMALQEFSPKLAPLLSIKSILALGFKTLTEDVSADPFSEIVGHISMNAPPINIPWLTTVTKRSTEDCEEPDKKRLKLNHEDSKTTYMPLIVKQMITTKKTKKRNK